ncbi:L-piperidine-6-carboxylate dehydrogenase [Parachitinimonas caeni]|uniref:aldehyde dehydrogenase (NAD(+)) n=1 Tax=Parachitinimonas caeni TaxID=3031301 RepID=A0ABT7DUN2_9NEIS|nr:aldehyde dehydrogenase family protein [Parachitinimonas caeni]MDK2123761.1 aldehyde dehydrogenase family protein [Parachitinimonas caeni]
MSLTPNTLKTLGLAELAAQPHWPSAVVAGEAHYADTNPVQFRSPIDGSVIGSFAPAPAGMVKMALEAAHGAYLKWRTVPAPKRGEFVRRIGEKVRERKSELAQVITLEAGKIRAEAEGEVQEWIDICEFAVGLSRQLHGLTIASERQDHRMMEQWHPIGTIGVISAFNFPMAVWAWNAMLALVCGDSVVWKPSEKTPLCALAVQRLIDEVTAEMGDAIPAHLCQLVNGLADVGEAIAASPLVPLVSATGSTRMGRAVAQTVAARLGRSLLELGGNNAMIVAPSADLELAVRAIVFAAAGTAGQRCTTLRRLIVHESVLDTVVSRVQKAYQTLPIGDPRKDGVLIGPLIDSHSFEQMQASLQAVVAQGGKIVCGGERVTEGVPAGGYYVRPAIVSVPGNLPAVCHETFAPILYVMPYSEFQDAVELQNGVPQGLSSAIFTESMKEAELFVSAAGSDCGIANVNIGTSGAEIGGAFGGEKDTGGGRESGSDSWKAYMRRTTNTINYGNALPLAQGIKFDV